MAEVKVRTDWKKKATELEQVLLEQTREYGSLKAQLFNQTASASRYKRAYEEIVETYQDVIIDLQQTVANSKDKRFKKLRLHYERAFVKAYRDMRSVVASGDVMLPQHLLDEIQATGSMNLTPAISTTPGEKALAGSIR